MSDDDQPGVSRPWRTPRLPPLVGYKEAAEILGVHKTALAGWLRPGSGAKTAWGGFGPDQLYVIPPARIAAGPVWVRSDIEWFAKQYGRRRALSAKPRTTDEVP